MPTWVAVFLTVAVNVSMAIVNFEIVPDGSMGFKIASAAAWVISNLLAIFGNPLKPPAVKPPSVPTLLLVLSLGGMVLAASSCNPVEATWKAGTTLGIAVSKCYKTSGIVDRQRQEKIQARAKSGDPIGAQIELNVWLGEYETWRKACD